MFLKTDATLKNINPGAEMTDVNILYLKIFQYSFNKYILTVDIKKPIYFNYDQTTHKKKKQYINKKQNRQTICFYTKQENWYFQTKNKWKYDDVTTY